jgi:hypothetical protein
VQDLDAFDLSPILGELAAHMVKRDEDNDYYRILIEFARSSRSVWREFKLRLVKALCAAKSAEAIKPFRFTWPENDCTYMVAAMDPDWPSSGPDGERMRMGALAMFTEAAKYDARSTKAIGLLIWKDGEHVNLDWCLVDREWRGTARSKTCWQMASCSGRRPSGRWIVSISGEMSLECNIGGHNHVYCNLGCSADLPRNFHPAATRATAV